MCATIRDHPPQNCFSIEGLFRGEATPVMQLMISCKTIQRPINFVWYPTKLLVIPIMQDSPTVSFLLHRFVISIRPSALSFITFLCKPLHPLIRANISFWILYRAGIKYTSCAPECLDSPQSPLHNCRLADFLSFYRRRYSVLHRAVASISLVREAEQSAVEAIGTTKTR